MKKQKHNTQFYFHKAVIYTLLSFVLQVTQKIMTIVCDFNEHSRNICVCNFNFLRIFYFLITRTASQPWHTIFKSYSHKNWWHFSSKLIHVFFMRPIPQSYSKNNSHKVRGIQSASESNNGIDLKSVKQVKNQTNWSMGTLHFAQHRTELFPNDDLICHFWGLALRFSPAVCGMHIKCYVTAGQDSFKQT